MVIEVVTARNLEAADTVKKMRVGEWRSLHTDFVNGQVVITFVNGIDDPDNSQENQDKRTQNQRKQILKNKILNNTISFEEMKEYFRFGMN